MFGVYERKCMTISLSLAGKCINYKEMLVLHNQFFFLFTDIRSRKRIFLNFYSQIVSNPSLGYAKMIT